MIGLRSRGRITIVRVAPALFVSQEVDVAAEADVGASGRSLSGATSAPDNHRSGGISDHVLFAAKLTLNDRCHNGAKIHVTTSVRLVVAIEWIRAVGQVKEARVTSDS